MNPELIEIFRAMRLKSLSRMAHDIGPIDELCEYILFDKLEWCRTKGGCDHCLLGIKDVFGYSNQIIVTNKRLYK